MHVDKPGSSVSAFSCSKSLEKVVDFPKKSLEKVVSLPKKSLEKVDRISAQAENTVIRIRDTAKLWRCDMKSDIERLKEIIEGSRSIVFFGGAGVSTESGIPDFRSASGIYNRDYGREVSPEEMISHTFYEQHTADFFDFYRNHLIFKDAEPNACHRALAELEKRGKLKAIVTQNIDGLHQLAGSKKVFELHGSVLRNYCENCHAFYPVGKILEAGVPHCNKCGGVIKPDVVLYEEGLDNDVLTGAIDAISNCDTLIVGGTTLIVYPAAGLIRYFRGKNLVLINMSATPADDFADLVIRDRIGEVFSQVMDWK